MKNSPICPLTHTASRSISEPALQNTRCPSTLLIFAMFATAIVMAGLAHSAVFVVTSTTDAGDATPGDGFCDDGAGVCTLRGAIREANSLAGADIIEVPAGTYLLTIAGKSEDSSATGDLDIRGDLTIIGAGSALTIVDGNELDRVFDCVYTGSSYSVEITGITVQNGNSIGSGYGKGGGIGVHNNHSNSGLTVVLEDVILDGNTAELDGCGLYVDGFNDVTIRNSIIRNHDCPDVDGAGMFTFGSGEIVDSIFQNNDGYNGGGLRVHGFADALNVRNTTFLDNAARFGGGLYNGDPLLTVEYCLFEGNNSIINGGGIYNGNDDIMISDTTFDGNSSESTSAAIYSGGSSSVDTHIERCLFVNNSALYYAAGFSAASGQHTIIDSTFTGNTCGFAGYGCAIITSALPTVTIDNCTFSDNENTSGGPTALHVYNGTVTVSHSIFAGGTGGPSCSGTVVSGDYNIENGTSCAFAAGGDLPSTDPLLAPLADNGGPSLTQALLPGSPAIDGGDPTGACTPTDQRGAPRPTDGDAGGTAECDIGAFELAPVADLSISKDDGQSTAVPGTNTVYTIAVDNAGPENANGVIVADPFDDPPFDRSAVIWTCNPGPGAGTTCPASGTGDALAVGVTVDIDASDTVVFTATAPIRSGATGTLSNTATVSSSSVADLNPDNDESTDEDSLTPEGDLWITKDDGVDAVIQGGSLTYTIQAGNDGPSDEPEATVTDTFPADLDCTWTCTASGDASCPAGPVNADIAETVVLPVGDSVIFTAVCAVSPTATGSINNTAVVAPSASVTDPDPGDNSDSDSTTVLEVDFGDAPDPSYPTLLASDGARHGVVAGFFLGTGIDSDTDGQPTAGADGDDLGGIDDEDGVVFPTAIGVGFNTPVEVTASASGLLNAWIDFNGDGDWADAGEQIFTDHALVAGVNALSLTVPPGATAGTTFGRFRFDSTGGLTPSGPADDGEVEDLEITIEDLAELELHLIDSPDPVSENGVLVYYLGVTNNGTLAATGVTLSQTLPTEVFFVSVDPGGPECTESGGIITCNLGALGPATSTQVTVEVEVPFGVEGEISSSAEITLDQPDPISSNNVANETTTVIEDTVYIFVDGFESGDTSRWSEIVP